MEGGLVLVIVPSDGAAEQEREKHSNDLESTHQYHDATGYSSVEFDAFPYSWQTAGVEYLLGDGS